MVCANFAHTTADGKTYQVEYYNLDMIISVGYRVNSKIGIAFRKWATNLLKEYLIKGYSVNLHCFYERLHSKLYYDIIYNYCSRSNRILKKEIWFIKYMLYVIPAFAGMT
ncbi:RhuM family protein [Rickettsia gravesii]|uniref:RhuM family protein n=1 Tax=Rickettsia gravesii TaxID=354585 RepID=UPI0009FECBC4|nr:RhuM family protein [Rickettsia gravesii]